MPALSSSPGQAPTQEERHFSEGKVAAVGPTSAMNKVTAARSPLPARSARGMGMYYLQAEVFCLYFPRHLASLLSIHLLPTALFRAAGCFLRFVLLTGLHAKFSTLNSTWPGPVCDTYTISPAGSGLCPFSRTTPPPST